MPSLDDVYKIVAAAEGSNIDGKDLRYVLSVANNKSGFSFGVFQFDCSTNTEAQQILRDVLDRAMVNNRISLSQKVTLYKQARLRNPLKTMSSEDFSLLKALFSEKHARDLIDSETAKYGESLRHKILQIIRAGKDFWIKKAAVLGAGMPLLTEGTREHLHLFAYLMASYNRYPANREVFIKWLTGEKAITANGPAGGWQLEAPPTLYDMHTFLKSLRIWDGTLGKYEHLRSRLDPVL